MYSSDSNPLNTDPSFYYYEEAICIYVLTCETSQLFSSLFLLDDGNESTEHLVPKTKYTVS